MPHEESLVAWKLMATQCVHFTPAVQAEASFNAMKDIRHKLRPLVSKITLCNMQQLGFETLRLTMTITSLGNPEYY